MASAETDLGQDALAGEELGAEADHEAEHGQATIPGFGEADETEAGGGVGHETLRNVSPTVTDREGIWVGRCGFPSFEAAAAAFGVENALMDNRLPLSVLFSLLVVAVLPLAIGLYWRGHMDLGAVLSHLAS
jgi:hypothetical protein